VHGDSADRLLVSGAHVRDRATRRPVAFMVDAAANVSTAAPATPTTDAAPPTSCSTGVYIAEPIASASRAALPVIEGVAEAAIAASPPKRSA